ncbi:hypothetical protein GCM10009114_29200 [Aliiglaciecola litoralis]|uniref:diguanylate cyclase n=1 Tax=Aliiglaciecola litoralis TaxID=582857 RepID=A0ABN1LPY2_9ALTE
MFLTITSFSYLQLISLKKALDLTVKEAIPTIITYDKIATNSVRLALFSEQLSAATNPPALRIAKEKVLQGSIEVAELLTEVKTDSVTLREFDAIQYELQELTALVQQKLNNLDTLHNTERDLYELFEEARKLNQQSARTHVSAWFDEFSQLTVQAGNVLSYDKLYQIRKSNADILDTLKSINALSMKMPVQLAQQAQALNSQLEQLVLGNKGLISLKILQLRMEGRTTGRGHFTEKLVSDFARSINFKSATVNEQILLEAAQEQARIANQLQLLGICFIVSICLFALITWVLRRRVIRRLLLLNQKVSGVKSLNTEMSNMRVEDEITDIASTFDTFFDTIEQQKKELSDLAMQDGLTSIANRRAFDIELVRSFNLASRHNLALSVLLLDVDFFKAYNDNLGHTKGDEALVKIAGVLKNTIRREIDFIGRYGGEEFVCILPGCDLMGARTVAENLRKAVANLRIPHKFNQIGDHVTISIGGANLDNFEQRIVTPDALLEAADKALYAAKNRGRNQVNIVKFE